MKRVIISSSSLSFSLQGIIIIIIIPIFFPFQHRHRNFVKVETDEWSARCTITIRSIVRICMKRTQRASQSTDIKHRYASSRNHARRIIMVHALPCHHRRHHRSSSSSSSSLTIIFVPFIHASLSTSSVFVGHAYLEEWKLETGARKITIVVCRGGGKKRGGKRDVCH